eukprot:4606930-Pyramimonas_sp.AAC.1
MGRPLCTGRSAFQLGTVGLGSKRAMLGKIEYKVQDTLGTGAKLAARGGGGGKGGQGRQKEADEAVYLGGKDAVLAGDPQQAPPIGDDP